MAIVYLAVVLLLLAATLMLSWLVFLAIVGIGIRFSKRRHPRNAGSNVSGTDGCGECSSATLDWPRFAVVIPAHDEGSGIAETVEATLSIDYPEDSYRVVVVADNCSDDTARVASEAGAEVLERKDPERRGKGFALRYAFDRLLSADEPEHGKPIDAIVVMDADSQPSHGLLRGLAQCIWRGWKVIQVENGILNPDAAALTWLLHVGNVMENSLFHEPKARLGLPTVLRGNGMCFASEVLQERPWDAVTTTEDTEYSLSLLEYGISVRYYSGEFVKAESPTSFRQLYTQRLRWAAGNASLSRASAFHLLRSGLLKRDVALFDAGWSLLATSRPLLLLAVLIPTAVGAGLGEEILFAWGLTLLGMFAFLLLASIGLAGLNARRVLWTLLLPAVLGHMLLTTGLGVIGVRRQSWVRTERP